MKQIIVVLLILFGVQTSAQKIRPKIKNLVHKIEEYNRLESKYIGKGASTTEQYKNFEKLRDKATIEELLQLLEHKNAVVKGYASWALADNKYPHLAEIISEFLRT